VSTGSEQRLTVVWLVLSAMTVTQLAVGSLDGREAFEPNAAITASAIVIALVKVRIIFREFMDVRHAPVWLCRLTDLWVGFAGVSLLGCYFAGRAFSTG
jgi:cytochrome c oxidase subunit IV